MLEQELKLAVAHADLSRVLELPVITGQATQRPRRQLVRSFYYDTPDLDLRRKGLELRVRKVGGQWVQTVKYRAGRLPGLHERAEIESPLASPEPDLAVLAQQPVAGVFESPEVQNRLERVFETRFWRRRVQVQLPNGALIEVCADSGGAYRDQGSFPISEVELELKRGVVQSLYDLARQINESVPVSLNVVERADLGYRLVQGNSPVPVTSSIPELSPDLPTGEGLAVIMATCLEQALGNEEVILEGDDIEGVHQMRVALRRLRSCLVMFRRLLPRPITERVRAGLEPVLKVLGPARDWDVFLAEQGGAILAALPDQTHLQELVEAARQHQAEAYARLRTAMRGADWQRQKLELSAWIACGEWRATMTPGELKRLRRPLGEVMDTILQQGHKRVVGRGRKIKQRSPQDLHRLRIAVKRQRYAVEFFSRCHPRKTVGGYLEQLRRLQGELGWLNDGVTACQLLRQLQDVPGLQDTIRFVEGWNARGSEELKQRLPSVWKPFRNEKVFWRKPVKRLPARKAAAAAAWAGRRGCSSFGAETRPTGHSCPGHLVGEAANPWPA